MNGYGFYCLLNLTWFIVFQNIFTSPIDKGMDKNELYVNLYAMINKVYIKLLYKMFTLFYDAFPFIPHWIIHCDIM
jgi:hypothetical protein